ncbi:MAG: type II secretion system minor pseudopilin GspJ [Hyphomonadaceae bacterium]|nr:type II secretion system minor pseudopilin GspJ [Hyphomonadaceae bacterium]
MRAHRTSESGFTLVEVLVSLFIFSLLSAASLAVLTTTLQNRTRLGDKNAELQKQSMMRILLKSDFAQAIAHPKMDPYGIPETILFAGGNTGSERLLMLSRTGWENPGGLERRSDLQSVDYILEDDVLIRRVLPRFNALPDTEYIRQPLVKNVDKVEFSFYNGDDWSDNWVTGLPPLGVNELPRLASIDILYLNGKSIRQVFYVGANQ